MPVAAVAVSVTPCPAHSESSIICTRSVVGPAGSTLRLNKYAPATGPACYSVPRVRIMRSYPTPRLAMDDAHKYAYRHLLFLAMNDIRALRGVVASPASFLNPPTSGDWIRLAARAGEIANWLHNLAGSSTNDFTRFDEDRFWREYAQVAERYPDVAIYREWFERSLKQSNGSAGQNKPSL